MNAPNIPSFYERFSDRWSTDAINDVDGIGKPYHRVYLPLGVKLTAFQKHVDEQAKPGTLSPKGLQEAARKYAAEKVVPEVRKMRAQLENQMADMDARRKRVGTPKLDRKDIVAAMERAEIRRYIRELPAKDRFTFAMDRKDEQTVAAILEMPAHMSGLVQDQWDRVEVAAVQRNWPGALEKFEAEKNSIETGMVALDLATKQVRDTCGFAASGATGQSPEFDRWRAAIEAPIEREIAFNRKIDAEISRIGENV